MPIHRPAGGYFVLRSELNAWLRSNACCTFYETSPRLRKLMLRNVLQSSEGDMTNRDGLMTVEVLYHHLDRIGVMPEVNQVFPCDEAPSGSLLVVEKTPIIRGGRRVGWTIRGRH